MTRSSRILALRLRRGVDAGSGIGVYCGAELCDDIVFLLTASLFRLYASCFFLASASTLRLWVGHCWIEGVMRVGPGRVVCCRGDERKRLVGRYRRGG